MRAKGRNVPLALEDIRRGERLRDAQRGSALEASLWMAAQNTFFVGILRYIYIDINIGIDIDIDNDSDIEN